MSEPSEPIKPEEHTEELNERLHESEVDDKKKILESMTQEELIELVLSSDETIKTKDSKIKAYEALIGTLITTVTDEKVKFGGLKREKEAYEAVYHQQLEKIEKMKATLVEGATLIARQEILINHFKDEYLPRTRRREHHDRSGCIIL